MADKKIGLQLALDGDEANKTVGSFKQQLKLANDELIQMSRSFGDTSEEAVNAAKKVAQLKDELGDAKDLSDAFNPDRKFQAFSNSLRAVTGGFAALQGAQALFGSQSEDIEKILLKVNAAMALSEGVNSILEAKDTFKQLNSVIQQSSVFQKANALATKAAAAIQKLFAGSVDQTATSFKFLKGAIAATGIGLLIIAIGEVVSALQSWSSAAEDAAAAQKKLDEQAIEGSRSQLQGELAFIDRQQKLEVARAKSKGATEKEIFNLEQQWQKQRVEAQTRFYNEVKDKDVKQGIDTLEEIKKQNADIEINDLNFKGQLFKQDEDDRKKKEDKRKEFDKKALEDQKNLDQQTLDRMWETHLRLRDADEEFAKAKAEAKIQQDENFRKMVEERGNTMDLKGDLTEEQINERVELVKSLAMGETEVKMIALDDEYKKRFAIIKGNEDAELGLKKWYSDQKRQIDFAETEARLNLYDTIANGIGNLGGILKQGTAAAKIAALSEIAIGTGTGFIRALEIAQKSAAGTGPAAAFAFPIFYASQIAAVLGAAGRAKSILSSSSGSGGGGASVSAPQMNTPSAPIRPQQSSTTLDQSSINAIGNMAAGGVVRAFVTESDVSGNINRIKQLNRMARLD